MALLHERKVTGIDARKAVGAAVFWLTLAWGAGALGQEPAEPTPDPTPAPRPEVRLRGEVVETGCFVIGGRKGAQHEQCAIACARAGQGLGVLDEKTKTLYVAVLDHRDGPTENPLLPFIAHRVEVRGTLLEYGELPAIIVSDVKSLRPPR